MGAEWSSVVRGRGRGRERASESPAGWEWRKVESVRERGAHTRTAWPPLCLPGHTGPGTGGRGGREELARPLNSGGERGRHRETAPAAPRSLALARSHLCVSRTRHARSSGWARAVRTCACVACGRREVRPSALGRGARREKRGVSGPSAKDVSLPKNAAGRRRFPLLFGRRTRTPKISTGSPATQRASSLPPASPIPRASES